MTASATKMARIPDRHRQHGGHQRPEGQYQHHQGQREHAHLASAAVVRADAADIEIECGAARDQHAVVVGVGKGGQRAVDRRARGSDVVPGFLADHVEGHEDQRGPAVLADEEGVAEGGKGKNRADIRLAPHDGDQRVEHGRRARAVDRARGLEGDREEFAD